MSSDVECVAHTKQITHEAREQGKKNQRQQQEESSERIWSDHALARHKQSTTRYVYSWWAKQSESNTPHRHS